MGKRGQITIFIIIGLIIIISAALVIYMVQTRDQVSPEEALVPEDAKPIYDYVARCMNTISQEALNIMANQGGYVQLPNTISRVPASYLPLDPSAILKVPYWTYNRESRIPSITFMQNEVKNHIEQGLATCIQNFASFPQYSIIQEAPPKANVLFTENDVTVRLTWPLEATLQGQERSVAIDEFVTKVPVRIKPIYELAKRIMYEENTQQFLEQYTIDAMVLHPDIPFDGFTLSCDNEQWRLDNVEHNMQQLTNQIMNQLRVQDTNYPPFLEDERVYEQLQDEHERIQEQLEAAETYEDIQAIDWPEQDNLPADRFAYAQGFFDVGTPQTDLKVKFHYSPQWDMHFNGHPNNNGILQTNAMSQFPEWLRFFCMNQYHFTYDVIYPVLVTVRDDLSYGGEGYNFKFAFPVLIHHNEPSRAVYSDQQFTDYSVGGAFCEETGEQYYDLKAVGYDAYGYQTDLTGVNVTYTCMGNACDLGTIVARQGDNRLTTQIPSACGNPFITFEKPGYLPTKAQLTERSLTVNLAKLRNIDVRFKKLPYHYVSEEDQSFRGILDLSSRNSISLYLRNSETGHEVVYEWPNDENNTIIELIDDTATYEMDVVLTQDDDIVGGFHSGNVTLEYSDMANAQYFNVYVVESQPIQTASDQYQLRLFDQIYSGRLNEQLQPTFS